MNAPKHENRQVLASPDRVGPYRLLRQLGAGGMSIVYLAEQTEPVQKLVALKVFAFPFADDRDLERFIREQTILARLDHPDIAKFYESGCLPTGEGYFAMEYFPGEPINQFCKANALDAEDRLKLIIQVCNAVTYAHQQGIIHRDLKPSNILVAKVDDEISVKVIDFGIAKDIESIDPNLALTRSLQILGTPLYMSPEHLQPETQSIDTRSDLFSLASVLVELLCGKAPCDTPRARELGILEIQRMLLSEAPLTLNQTTSERVIDREVQWILTKALEKNKDRRYPSVAAFADDLNRYLKKQPVEAGPPSGFYLISKFVSRHRGTAILSLITVLVLLASTIISITQSSVARRAREDAERELYYTEMRIASESARNGDHNYAKRLLERNSPFVTPRHWKGKEWNYLNAVLHREPILIKNCGVRVLQLGLSSDKKYLLVLLDSGIVELWEADSFELLTSIDPKSYNVCVAWHPTLPRFAIGGRDKYIRIYEVVPDEVSSTVVCSKLHEFKAHLDHITCLLFTPDEKHLVSSSDDDAICIWDVSNWALVNQTIAESLGVESMKLSKDGSKLVTGGEDGAASVWNFPALTPVVMGDLDDGKVRAIEINRLGEWIVAGNITGSLVVEELVGKRRIAQSDQLDGIEQLLLLDESDRVVTADRGGNLAIHNVVRENRFLEIRSDNVDRWKVGSRRLIALCQLSEELILTADQAGNVSQWSIKPKARIPLVLKVENEPDQFETLLNINDSEMVLTTQNPERLYWRDLTGRRPDRKLFDFDDLIHEIAYIKKTKQIIAGGEGRLILYDFPSMNEIGSWNLPGRCLNLTVSDDESRFCCLSSVPNGIMVHGFIVGTEKPHFEFFLKGGQRGGYFLGDLIGLVKDNSVYVYSTDRPIDPDKPMAITPRHDSTLYSFHALDDKRMVTVGDDRLLKICEIKTGALLSVQEADSSGLASASLNSDKTRLATGSVQGSVKLWDTTTVPFREVLRLSTGNNMVWELHFALEDQLLLIDHHRASDMYFDSRVGQSSVEKNGELSVAQ